MSLDNDFVSLMLKKSKEKEKTEVFRPLVPEQEDPPESASVAVSSADMKTVEDFVRKMKDKIK